MMIDTRRDTKCSSYHPHFAPNLRRPVKRRHSIASMMPLKDLKSKVSSIDEINPLSRRLRDTPLFSPTQVLVFILGFILLCVFAPPLSGLQHMDWKQFEPKEPLPESVGSVRWWPCGYFESPTKCGWIIVPKDYANSSAGTTKIALSILPAKSEHKKGTVFFNPGGPGVRGKPYIIEKGDILQRVIGNEYDIVGFDPRGVGETVPSVQCFRSGMPYSDFKYNTVLERGYEYSSNLSPDELKDAILAQQYEADALYKTQFNICAQRMGDELKYMGTTTVARDVAFMAETLDGDNALINLYGGSYGTVLGQYVVNMFPDRVGRIVLDGVVDTVRWSSLPPYKWVRQWLSSTNDTYRHFVSECFNVGPQGCPLANELDTMPSNIMDRIENFVDGLYHRPLAVPLANRPGLLTAGRVRNFLIITLLKPFGWLDASQALSEAMNGSGTRILNFLNDWRPYSDLERPAVSCSDAPPFKSLQAEDVVTEYLDVYYNVSKSVFSVLTTEPDSGCQFWPVKPVERFIGPWNHTLRNPILLLSNTADPVTPITSGNSVASLLGNSSRLLVVDSPGHCSLFLQSLCMTRHVQAYFANGTLPEENTICSDALKPFPSAQKPMSPQDTISSKDLELITQLRGLSEQWEIAKAGLDHPKLSNNDHYWWD